MGLDCTVAVVECSASCVVLGNKSLSEPGVQDWRKCWDLLDNKTHPSIEIGTLEFHRRRQAMQVYCEDFDKIHSGFRMRHNILNVFFILKL